MSNPRITKVFNMYPSGKGEFGFTIQVNHTKKYQFVVKKCKSGKYILNGECGSNIVTGFLSYKIDVGLIYSEELVYMPEYFPKSDLVVLDADIHSDDFVQPTYKSDVVYIERDSYNPFNDIPDKLRKALDDIAIQNMLT